MDKNKLKLLQDISYKIKECCGDCTYSKFKPNANFGICKIHEYNHLKHTDNPRKLSIYRYGYCSKFKWYNSYQTDFGLMDQFVEKN